MIQHPNLKEKYLDGELLFRKYYEMGDARSINRLSRWAIAEGMAKPTKVSRKNPYGLPTMGVWKAMWRWASLKDNCQVAFEIYRKWTGNDIDDWNEHMLKTIKTAWQFTTVAKYQRFLKQNGWIE